MSAAELKTMWLSLRPALIRFTAARGLSPDEAEDLLQELYLKLDSQPIGPVAEPRAYLYRMTNNLLLDRRRAGARRARREDEWSDRQLSLATDSYNRTSAETTLIVRQQLQLVNEALATLPVRTVEIFRRFRIDGVTQKAIANDLGISVSAVEKHLQRAYRTVLDTKARLDADIVVPRRLIDVSDKHGA